MGKRAYPCADVADRLSDVPKGVREVCGRAENCIQVPRPESDPLSCPSFVGRYPDLSDSFPAAPLSLIVQTSARAERDSCFLAQKVNVTQAERMGCPVLFKIQSQMIVLVFKSLRAPGPVSPRTFHVTAPLKLDPPRNHLTLGTRAAFPGLLPCSLLLYQYFTVW